MVDFKAHRQPQKSADEIEFESLCKAYEETFGKPYVFAYGINEMSMAETLADIRQRIANNKPQTAPEYKPGVDY